MKYISTRGNGEKKSFQDVLLAGLAEDGGLYVPAELPRFSPEKIRSLRGLPYNELAFEVISPFVAGEIEDSKLRELIDDSYSSLTMSCAAMLNHWFLVGSCNKKPRNSPAITRRSALPSGSSWLAHHHN